MDRHLSASPVNNHRTQPTLSPLTISPYAWRRRTNNARVSTNKDALGFGRNEWMDLQRDRQVNGWMSGQTDAEADERVDEPRITHLPWASTMH